MMQSDRRPAGPLFAMIAAGLLLAAPVSAATFYIQQTDAAPGQAADVCVWMTGGNNDVAGVQMDLSWDPACMEPAAGGNRPRCRSNPDTGKTVQSAARGASTVRAIMLSFSDVDPIPDGELFCCQFRITNDPPGGVCSVGFSNLIASSPTGRRTDARSGRGGAVNIARGAGVPPPVVGGFEPAPPPAADPGRPAPAQDPAPRDEARAEAPRAESDRPSAPAADAPGAAPGQVAAAGQPGQPGQPAADAGELGLAPGDAYRAGDTGFAERVPHERLAQGAEPAPVQVGEAVRDAAEDEEERDASTPVPATPTPEPEAAPAQVQPTPTPPAATPTQPQPTATPTVSKGWLGGCTLMR